MSVCLPILFLDTCVWLDLYLLDRPGRQAAQALVRYALDHDISLAYAAALSQVMRTIVKSCVPVLSAFSASKIRVSSSVLQSQRTDGEKLIFCL
jgi:hypothetical protein